MRALGHDAVLPRVLGPSERAGQTPDGIVVGAGAGDNAAAALGLDAQPGDVVVSIGTSRHGLRRDGCPDRRRLGHRRGLRRRERQRPPPDRHAERRARARCRRGSARASRTPNSAAWRSRPSPRHPEPCSFPTSRASARPTCPTPRRRSPVSPWPARPGRPSRARPSRACCAASPTDWMPCAARACTADAAAAHRRCRPEPGGAGCRGAGLRRARRGAGRRRVRGGWRRPAGGVGADGIAADLGARDRGGTAARHAPGHPGAVRGGCCTLAEARTQSAAEAPISEPRATRPLSSAAAVAASSTVTTIGRPRAPLHLDRRARCEHDPTAPSGVEPDAPPAELGDRVDLDRRCARRRRRASRAASGIRAAIARPVPMSRR